MDYSIFKSEYPYRDTKRKILNDLKSDIKELEYRIEAIDSQIKVKGVAWLYGELYFKKDLKVIQQELNFTNQLLKETR